MNSGEHKHSDHSKHQIFPRLNLTVFPLHVSVSLLVKDQSVEVDSIISKFYAPTFYISKKMMYTFKSNQTN